MEVIERHIEAMLVQGFLHRPRERRLIVAVSGGRDSVALLHALNKLKTKFGVELIVAHVNHGFRKASKKEEAFVVKLAKKYALDCELAALPELPEGENLEAWAREERYKFFQQLLKERAASWVVTAHHSNDDAESFLQKLFSGRLQTSASSIAKCCDERRVFRPLLDITREQIDSYVKRESLRFVEDNSNYDVSRTRSWIRHKLLPKLKRRLNPKIVQSLREVQARLEADESYLWSVAEEAAIHIGTRGEIAQLLALPEPVGFRALQLLAVSAFGERGWRIGRTRLCRALEWLPRGEGQLELGSKMLLVKHVGGQFELLESVAMTESPLTVTRLRVPGDTERSTDGYVIRARVYPLPEGNWKSFRETLREQAKNSERAYFDLNKVGSHELVVRGREEGDRVRVYARGKRKLKKIFQELAVSRISRERQPIVESNGEVIWVPGLVRSDVALVEPATSEVLELEYVKL